MHTKIRLALDPSYLGLTLLPTEKCNFRCTYCYEDYTLGRMKPDIVEGVKNLLTLRASDLTVLNVSWFGGEPLLTRDILFDILSHAQKLKEKHHFRMMSSMTTNGYLLDKEVLCALAKLGVSNYQISFDGARDYHNVKRFINHSDRSFDRIWQNVILFNKLREEGVLTHGKITLRLHIHADNHASLMELIALINAHLNPQFFDVLLKHIAHLGGEHDADFEILEHKSKKSRQRHHSMNQALQAFSPVNPDADDASYMCYATMPNSFAIRSDGSLAKCTVALNNPKNHIGKLTKEGHFLFEGEKVLPWIKAFQTLNKATLGCPLSFVEHHAA